jgi:hypothetical protein
MVKKGEKESSIAVDAEVAADQDDSGTSSNHATASQAKDERSLEEVEAEMKKALLKWYQHPSVTKERERRHGSVSFSIECGNNEVLHLVAYQTYTGAFDTVT